MCSVRRCRRLAAVPRAGADGDRMCRAPGCAGRGAADSTTVRWMGPARYAICGLRKLCCGLRAYSATVRLQPEPTLRTRCAIRDGWRCSRCEAPLLRPAEPAPASVSAPAARPPESFAMILVAGYPPCTLDATRGACVYVGLEPRQTHWPHGDSSAAPTRRRRFPYAHLADGMLDVMLVRPLGRLALLRFLASIALGREAHCSMHGVQYYKTHEVRRAVEPLLLRLHRVAP